MPELGIHLLLGQLGEYLDGCALRPDDVLADGPRHNLEVAEVADADPLVPLRQRFGKLVQVLVRAPLRVNLDQR